MIEIASQIILCLSIAALIGFLVGLLLGRSLNTDKTNNIYNSNKYVYKNQGNIYNKPLIRSIPRPSGKDDLKNIESINDELENQLNDLGIYHFDQIAKWSIKNCRWVEEYLILEDNMIIENKWLEKAKSLSTI